MTDSEFVVLGDLALRVDGVRTPLGARRERGVLALLLAAHGETVSADRLIDEFWGDAPPARALASLQVAVSRLRSLIEPDRRPRIPPQRLLSSASGYCLRVPDDAVDAARFETLAARAASAPDPAQRLSLADEAVSLWRGQPYAGLADLPLVAAEANRLDAVRLDVAELRAQALLDLGRHDVVATHLRATAAENPFRERLWALLALAYYRCDRQADALATLRALRMHLVDELGVDPSPALRQLEVDVLAQAASLAAPPKAPVPNESSRAEPPSTGEPSGHARVGAPETLVTKGRAAALEAVRAALDRLAGAQGGVLLLSGEPGIGKSVIAAELARQANARGLGVLVGRCHEADVAPAYWPWLPVLRHVAGADPAPELAALVGISDHGADHADAGSASLRTYDAACRALAASAAERPLVVVLEDIHWADTSSLRLLAYAAEALAGVPVLLVPTRRTVDAPESPALTTVLAALSRLGAARVTLRGLPFEGVAQLVDEVTGTRSPELARVVAERTDGNPFFVLELARLLAARDATEPSDAAQLHVPDGVRDVLRLRVARLPEQGQQVLAVASVVGRDIDPGVVAEVLELEVDLVLDVLDEVVASGVVVEDAGHYLFTHALTRETVYAGLPASRRLRWHAAVACALERRLASNPELVSDVAHHYALAVARRPALAPLAVRHAEDAARLAESRGAYDEALGLWDRALAADRLDPDPDLDRRHRLLVSLADAQLRMGKLAGARATLDEAMMSARDARRWDLVAEAATSFRGAGVWHWREFGTVDEAMIGVLVQCLEHLPPGALRASVLACLQMEHTYGWQTAQSDLYGKASVEEARASGDREVLFLALLLRASSLWGPSNSAERIAICREMINLASVDEHRLYAYWQLACAVHQAGRPEEADEWMTQCSAIAARLRHTSADVPLMWWQLMRAIERGDPGVQALADAAAALHRRTSVVAFEEVTGLLRVRLAPDGADVPPDVVASARGNLNPAYRAAIAQALAMAGRADEGVDLLGDPPPAQARDYAALAGDCLRVDTLALAERTDLLPAALSRITPWAGEMVTYGSIDSLGSVEYFVGRGLQALGDREGAAQAYERAVAFNDRIGNVPWGRRAAERLATVRRTGQEARKQKASRA